MMVDGESLNIVEFLASFNFRGIRIPAHMHQKLSDYIEHGVPPGDFLTAVLTNSLKDSVTRADDQNLFALPAYVAFFYDMAPSGCWGSRKKVDDWLAMHAVKRNNKDWIEEEKIDE